LIGDLVRPKDVVLLVTPIDSEAPEGRMILPQNQTIRDALDNQCVTVVVRESELFNFLQLGIKPALVITDSSAFGIVAETLPEEIPLTSFSILFARMKGNFTAFLEGTPYISRLKDGDHILLLESCTHQTSCDDIGRVKIPKLLQQFTGKRLHFKYTEFFPRHPMRRLHDHPQAVAQPAPPLYSTGCTGNQLRDGAGIYPWDFQKGY